MIDSPDIAVVIPARDAAETVGAALASVHAQTVRPRLVVAIDDGSVDSTRAVLREWAGVLPMQYLTAGGQGPGPARDLGVAAAIEDGCGWIALLDADDMLLPNHLGVLWQCRPRSTSGRGLVIGDGYLWDPSGQSSMPRYRSLSRLPPIHRLHRELHVRNCVFIGSMFSAGAYREAGGFRDMRAGEDWDLWRRMLGAGCDVAVSPRATYLYRVRPDATMWTTAGLGGGLVAARYAVEEAPTHKLRQIASRTVRRARAELCLAEAYDAAACGRYGQARTIAVRALAGRRSVAIRSLMMVAAPRWTLRLRGRCRPSMG